MISPHTHARSPAPPTAAPAPDGGPNAAPTVALAHDDLPIQGRDGGPVPLPRNDGPAGRKRRNDWNALRSLAPYLWPRMSEPGAAEIRARIVTALALLAASKAVTVGIPVVFKTVIDTLRLGDAQGWVVVPVALLFAYGAMRIAAQAFAELREAVFAKVAQRAMRQAGLRTFQHLHKLALRYHMDRHTGGLSRAVERGTLGIDALLDSMLFNVIPTMIEIVMVCTVLWVMFDVRFAAVTFTTIAIYAAWTMIITDWRLKYRRQMNDMEGEAANKAVDSLLNYETVKYFGNEKHEAARYDVALQSYEQAAIKAHVSLSLLNVGQGTVVAVGVTSIMLMAAFGVQAQVMTLGDIVMVNAFLIQLYLPLNRLGMVYREIKQSLIDMDEMFSLLRVPPEIADKPGALPLEIGGGEIAFENVSFDYNPNRRVLKDVSFRVPAAKKVAIVGPSGAGKSTISRLLYRFYDVTGGRITIDGQDIRDVTQDSVRAAIGIVPQDTVLFNDTIRYNIAYGRPAASEDEIEHAARLAAIHDFIVSLPDGYETRVGERGLKLSGGEKQRVAIARTILKGPQILLFDEATSALDTHTEREIQKALTEVSANRTTLVIAHRLSTIVDADQILVLEHGTIVERGTHRDLLARPHGIYAHMWARQQEQQQAEDVLKNAAEEEAIAAAVPGNVAAPQAAQ
jgi:ATP-binding cassette subfamily B protein